MKMEQWRLEVGCFREDASVSEAWVRVLELLVHLWGKAFFKMLSDACGGFIVVDMDTDERCHLKWARL